MAKRNAWGFSRVTTAQLRANPGRILRRLSSKEGERFVIAEQGKAKAVLLSLKDYSDLISPEHPLMADIRAYSAAHGGDQITMEEIDAEIAAYRAEQRERDASTVCCD